MKHWNSLENRLRCWTPRAPSPKLKARLFPADAELAGDVSVAFGGGWRWLAPVMGCFLLLLVVLNPPNGRVSDWPSADTNHLLATIVSNQNLAAYMMADSHSKQNGLAHETFEWTNQPHTFLGLKALPLTTTNSLLH